MKCTQYELYERALWAFGGIPCLVSSRHLWLARNLYSIKSLTLQMDILFTPAPCLKGVGVSIYLNTIQSNGLPFTSMYKPNPNVNYNIFRVLESFSVWSKKLGFLILVIKFLFHIAVLLARLICIPPL